jgi:hypothetical protein
MQAACADIMRLAAIFMIDEGLALCATVHDAVLIEAPIDRINADVEIAKSCWRRASEIVLDGFGLDADSKIVCYPEVYHDDDGKEMWTRLLKILDELELVPDEANNPQIQTPGTEIIGEIRHA